MALPYTVEDLEKIDESQREFYVKTDNGYKLDVEGIEDFEGKLNNHNQKILGEKKKLQQKLQELESQLESINQEKAKKTGDFESLLKDSETKRSQLEQKLKDTITQHNRAKIDATVTELAAKLCDGANAKIIRPHISQRVTIDENGEMVILGVDGKPSVAKLADLENEFKSDNDFSHLIRGSKASGGGAVGGGQTVGNGIRIDVDKMSSSELMSLGFSKKAG